MSGSDLSPARPSTAEPTAGRGAHAERLYMAELGQRLRRIREQRGLTQQRLAKRACVATDMISRLENGRYTSPGLRTILRIARGLGVAPAELLPDHADHPAEGARARVRLSTLVAQATAEEVELIAELALVVLSRRMAD